MKEKRFLPHFVLTLEKKGDARLGFELKIIVTRKIRRAVDRNRVKRVVREFFRQKRGLLPWKTVVCRLLPNVSGVKNADIFQELGHLL